MSAYVGNHLLLVVAVIDAACFRGEIDDLPFAAVLFDQQVDQAEMRAPEAAHHGGLALQRALDGVGTGNAVPGLRAGEDEMLVAGEDRVDALDGGEMSEAFSIFLLRRAIDAGMGERDDDIGAFFLHGGTQALAACDDVAGIGLAFEVLESQSMICGGTKPMKPTLTVALVAGAVLDLSFRRSCRA